MRQLDLFGVPVKTNEETTVTETAIQTTIIPGDQNFATQEIAEPEIIAPAEKMNSAIEPPADIDAIEDEVDDTQNALSTGNEELIEPQEPGILKPGLTEPIKKRGRKSFREMDAELGLIDIPEDDILFQKQYYAISEVAQWFKVNTSLLRFWETEFDVLKPRKNRKGDRLFRPEDVKNLQVIYYLLRNRKFTIEGAKEYLKTNKKKAEGNIQVIQSLTKFRSFLVELRANLD